MSIDETIWAKFPVPEEFKTLLKESFDTIDEVRVFLKKVYESNETPEKNELLLLEKKLIMENFSLKRQSDRYYQNWKYYHEKYIRNATKDTNSKIFRNQTMISLQTKIAELNSLTQETMKLFEDIPTLQLGYADGISDSDSLLNKLSETYSHDKILSRLADLDTKIEDTDYDEMFQADMQSLQDLIQQEKLQRFRLFLTSKALYTNRFKRLKELDQKWSKRLDELVGMENRIARFGAELNNIGDNTEENAEDDQVLTGADVGEEYEEEEDDYEEEQDQEQELEQEQAHEAVEEDEGGEEEMFDQKKKMEEQGSDLEAGQEQELDTGLGQHAEEETQDPDVEVPDVSADEGTSSKRQKLDSADTEPQQDDLDDLEFEK